MPTQNHKNPPPFSIVNCTFLIVNWNFTFSAKEKDSETGLSYFGSRYYNSDLSIWLSVDPMASKYPSFSPYVYCANNPVKLVDPNGEEIGDYFNQYGKYLGTDCVDDGKVHIIQDDIWNNIRDNMSWEGNDGTRIISQGIGAILSDKPSSVELSDAAIFNCVNHYNSTTLTLKKGDLFNSELLTTRIFEIDNNGDNKADSYKMELLCNSSEWRKNSVFLDNYYNIKSSFDHENYHVESFNYIGGSAYLSLPSSERETAAFMYQKNQSNFERTSNVYKRAFK